jgi:hypothetical protein
VAVVGETTVTVYDADNGSNSTRVPWVVFIRPFLSGVSGSPTSLDVGQSVALSAIKPTGGSGVYTYRWSGLPAGCLSQNSSSIECSPSVPGTFEITLNLTDTHGLSSNRTFTLNVDPDPTVSTPTALPGSVDPGQRVTFSVSGSGGSGNFTYRWDGLPTGCFSLNGTSVSCKPSAVGTYEVTVNLTDSNGFRVTSGSLRFTVTSPATLFGLPPLEAYTLLAEIAVIAAVVLAVVYLRKVRRRRPRASP